MQVPSPEPDLILPLLFICLVLVGILCTSCLILVIVVIRLTIHAQRSLPVETKEKKDDAKEKVKEEVKKTIKKLGGPVQDLLHSAQDHLKHPKNPFTQQSISQYLHPSAEMSHIQNMVAVAQNDGNTILFQVNKNYEIIFYESRTPSERIPRKKYDMNTLKIKGKSIKVNPKLPIISAVAFTHPESCGGRAQVKTTCEFIMSTDNLFLREIIRVGDKDEEWNDGMDFNDKNHTICEVSGLAANVFQSTADKKSFQIKVYYQRDSADEFADVAYNVVGVTDEWSTRPNVTEA
ncbi:uncharacterized protein BKA55DRAFT_693687 [Fusarium redolens]|uniref:Uncharacterized protein n=1 Tax=Fusarium redolens TaxID=48865 RepID=A0A9P9GIQ3_FUSRE|nr:uncharacterized protein BKA55DRAFT_693687 [Fusarium redolens]KAH7240145.1 hypothetical protein BKA55DRAFT_693687 [Fusarium redolens]